MNLIIKRNYFYCIIATAAFAFASCASGPKKVDFPVGTDAKDKTTEVRNRLNDDQSKQYDMLSPKHFEEAKKAISNAQNKLNQGESSSQVLDEAGEALAHLQIVEENAHNYSGELAPALNARQAAITAHADQALRNEFASADESFNDFGRDIEKGNFHPEAKEISKLEAKYSELELNAIKATVLGENRTILERCENEDAKKKAPQTLKTAQLRYDSALRAIEANRRDSSAYKAAVTESLQNAHKLEQVLNTIEKSNASEAAAVQIYDQQQQLATTQQSLNQAKAEAQAAQQQVSDGRQTMATLQAQNARYADKENLNQKIESVKHQFSSDEAEVLRDGNKIILRLKTMQFSPARFELTQSSLDTLQKVKNMIAVVPVSKIVVEGHTDTIGGEKKNLLLSQKRAETVKKYLVAENSVPEGKIEAQGFGYKRPLTSDKTAEGRAINRRVDVVIETNAQL